LPADPNVKLFKTLASSARPQPREWIEACRCARDDGKPELAACALVQYFTTGAASARR